MWAIPLRKGVPGEVYDLAPGNRERNSVGGLSTSEQSTRDVFGGKDLSPNPKKTGLLNRKKFIGPTWVVESSRSWGGLCFIA